MNKKEFIQAYQAFGDAIFRHCYFRVFDRETALDLTQETFKKTWIYTAKGKKIDNVRAFLYKTAANLVIDHKRRKRPISLEMLKDQGIEPGATYDENIYSQVDAQQAIGVIRKLDDKSRQVLLLRFVDEYSPKEIAKIIGRSQNVVSVRLNRAKEKLRELLRKRKA